MMNKQKVQIMNQNFILAITISNALQNLKLQLKLKNSLLTSLILQQNLKTLKLKNGF